MGSRGLTLLSRFISASLEDQSINLEITVFDHKTIGVGEHDITQPDHLLLNTVAGQLTMFPELDSEIYGTRLQGHSFLEWCHRNDIRIDLNSHQNQTQGQPVSKGDFLPRRLLGSYLHDSYQQMIQQVPDNLKLTVIHEAVVDIEVFNDRYLVITENEQIETDAVCLTLGHTGSQKINHNIGYRDRDALKSIQANETVLVNGLGLTAMDLIAELTLGKGGKIIRENRGSSVIYQPSGHEPNIIVTSNNGIPFRVRPEIRQDDSPNESYFLKDRISQLKESHQDIDFYRDIFPYLKLEMRVSYVMCQMSSSDKISFKQTLNTLHEKNYLEINSLIESIESDFEPLNFNDVFTQKPEHCQTQDEYQAWFCHFIEQDLEQAWQGFNVSPLKTAIETLRDLRDLIRNVVNFNGLSQESEKEFYTRFYPLCNKLVGGPQRERHEDILALINHGVVKVTQSNHYQDNVLTTAFGQTIHIDHVIDAYVSQSGLESSSSPLLQNLNRKGLVTARNIGNSMSPVQVNHQYKVTTSNGEKIHRLWCIGPNIEGVTFYNHYVPTVGKLNRPFSEADMVVKSILSELSNI
ncbi:hypothetical protein EA58_00760 [Photobacterium galatheae]|uniref:FAD-dependent urate hydroxylase HpyO/Asp monooxygenase CreE-like FAD/NAD(P)-binding domain-containing protein n=2 Tax=Photobacterium galatheae TaxID=1654360 RepID=A0A066RSU4_9GAMM|nr:FAD/NAD(P)-binding protein [Photobacterium galatheae]KDM93429.1 hypothetical protein EA58_00760 [Photobacterium galatheae]